MAAAQYGSAFVCGAKTGKKKETSYTTGEVAEMCPNLGRIFTEYDFIRKMTKETFQTYQEQTFDSFCKTVIRNESIDAFRTYNTRAVHEIQMSALSERKLAELSTEDTYHFYHRTFYVLGFPLTIHDEALGEALQFLVPRQRDILFLYYVFERSDVVIGRMLGISHHAVQTRRMAALRRLQKELKERPYE